MFTDSQQQMCKWRGFKHSESRARMCLNSQTMVVKMDLCSSRWESHRTEPRDTTGVSGYGSQSELCQMPLCLPCLCTKKINYNSLQALWNCWILMNNKYLMIFPYLHGHGHMVNNWFETTGRVRGLTESDARTRSWLYTNSIWYLHAHWVFRDYIAMMRSNEFSKLHDDWLQY